jgi:hypothetical protein
MQIIGQPIIRVGQRVVVRLRCPGERTSTHRTKLVECPVVERVPAGSPMLSCSSLWARSWTGTCQGSSAESAAYRILGLVWRVPASAAQWAGFAPGHGEKCRWGGRSFGRRGSRESWSWWDEFELVRRGAKRDGKRGGGKREERYR